MAKKISVVQLAPDFDSARPFKVMLGKRYVCDTLGRPRRFAGAPAAWAAGRKAQRQAARATV